MKPIEGGITAARGFVAGAGTAGLRSQGGLDVVVIATSGDPASAAATFTTNRFRAAPILVAQEALDASGGRVRAIVINAGCANAGTGPQGLDDAREVVAAAAAHMGCPEHEILPASTGLIGSRLSASAIAHTVRGLHLNRDQADDAARAIMTTDTRPKQAAYAVTLPDGRTIRLGGMAKGSGMIHPQMATMLAFLTTDAPLTPDHLRELLGPAVERSFNQVTVDGDTSTNDAVMLLAGGAAGGPQIEPGTSEAASVAAALETLCRDLAMQIAADGEGAQHLIEVEVTGARDDTAARRIARTIAGSSLVKTAVHGADPNWGRIAAAAGRSGEEIDTDRLNVSIGPVLVFSGAPCPFDQAAAVRALREETVRLTLDAGIGQGSGMAWGCDLSAEYVSINSDYTT